MIGDAAQHISEPGLGVDAVEFGRGNQGIDRGCALAAAIGTGKEPSAAPQHKCQRIQQKNLFAFQSPPDESSGAGKACLTFEGQDKCASSPFASLQSRTRGCLQLWLSRCSLLRLRRQLLSPQQGSRWWAHTTE